MRVRGLTGGPDADVVYGFLNASVAIRFLGWASGKEIVFKCSLKVFFISLTEKRITCAGAARISPHMRSKTACGHIQLSPTLRSTRCLPSPARMMSRPLSSAKMMRRRTRRRYAAGQLSAYPISPYQGTSSSATTFLETQWVECRSTSFEKRAVHHSRGTASTQASRCPGVEAPRCDRGKFITR